MEEENTSIEILQRGFVITYSASIYLYFLFWIHRKLQRRGENEKGGKGFEQWMYISVLMLFTYFCEYGGFFSQGQKIYTKDNFLFILIIFFALSFYSLRQSQPKNDASKAKNVKLDVISEPPEVVNNKALEVTDFMNRFQTEEWKGWMQYIFLMYHYFRAMEYYNLIRVLVSSYAFLTGFGNYLYFQQQKDFSLKRLLSMLFRLNFLTILLMGTMDVPYILYYIVPLHTFYFLLTYCSMRIFPSWNHRFYLLRFKFLIVFLILWLIWDTPRSAIAPFTWFNSNLSHNPILSDSKNSVMMREVILTDNDGVIIAEKTVNEYFFDFIFQPFQWIIGMDGSLHEWHFRTYLDHYSTIYGIIFAMHISQISQWFGRVEAMKTAKRYTVKGLMFLYLSGVSYWWYERYYTLDKYDYNAVHPYTTFIPIIIYLILRNYTPTLRSYHMEISRVFGTITLETYLLQYHLFLSGHAKTLLFYLLHEEMMLTNLIIAFSVLWCSAYVIFQSTNDLKIAVFDDARGGVEGSLKTRSSMGDLVIRWCGYMSVLLFASVLNFVFSSLVMSLIVAFLIVTFGFVYFVVVPSCRRDHHLSSLL